MTSPLHPAARALGVTWKRAGDALGLDSADAARERYEELDKRIGPA